MGIAVVLGATAIFLARESKGLLIGEAAMPEVQEAILGIAQQDPAVQKANGVLTIHMGPREIVAGLSVEFEDHLTAPEIEDCVQRLEERLKREVPEVTTLFVKPQTKGTWESAQARLSRRRAIRGGGELLSPNYAAWGLPVTGLNFISTLALSVVK